MVMLCPPFSIFATRWIGDSVNLMPVFGAAIEVSSDGKVVVGVMFDQNFNPRAFRWKEGDPAAQDLGTLGGNQASAQDVSADGSIKGFYMEVINGNYAESWNTWW